MSEEPQLLCKITHLYSYVGRVYSFRHTLVDRRCAVQELLENEGTVLGS